MATPFGSVAYGDADLDVTVGASSLELELRRGEVVTELAPGTSGYPKDGLKGTGRAKVEGHRRPGPAAGRLRGSRKGSRRVGRARALGRRKTGHGQGGRGPARGPAARAGGLCHRGRGARAGA